MSSTILSIDMTQLTQHDSTTISFPLLILLEYLQTNPIFYSDTALSCLATPPTNSSPPTSNRSNSKSSKSRSLTDAHPRHHEASLDDFQSYPPYSESSPAAAREVRGGMAATLPVVQPEYKFIESFKILSVSGKYVQCLVIL